MWSGVKKNRKSEKKCESIIIKIMLDQDVISLSCPLYLKLFVQLCLIPEIPNRASMLGTGDHRLRGDQREREIFRKRPKNNNKA